MAAIAVTFPLVHKMELTVTVPIASPDSPNLLDVKKEILDLFWKAFKVPGYEPKIGPHGKSEHVFLYDKDEVLIATDKALAESLKKEGHFSVTFKHHSLQWSKKSLSTV
ncbi:MAG TPA: hypothetical protein VGJ00_07690 [Rhabdochlamydiaceae bacterium]